MPDASTRDRLLDAFESLLVHHGSKGATLEAVAGAAQVSKGGLLYHFASKDQLVEGMLERLRTQADADVERMRAAPAGPVDYYLETSVDSGSDFDRALIAAARIAQENEPRALETLQDVRRLWYEVLLETVHDEALARTIQLIGDGLYFHDVTGAAHPAALAHVREVLGRLR